MGRIPARRTRLGVLGIVATAAGFGQGRQRVPVLLGSRQQWPKVIDGLLGGGLRLPRSGQFGLGALALGPQRQLRGPVGFEGESGLGDVVGEQPGTGVPQFGLHGGGLTRNLGLSA